MRLGTLLEHLDTWYDPTWAEPWDTVGLVCGDPEADVRRVLFAVDPTLVVVEEALELGADLIVTHHPLLLTPVSSVAADSAKGAVIHRLISNGIALFTAHTNADVPEAGVNESLAEALGLVDPAVLRPTDGGGMDKLVFFVPTEDADRVRQAVTDAGAGSLGAYDSCTFSVVGEGRFRPLEGSDPTVGTQGQLEVVTEARVEVLYPRPLRARMVAALRRAHPYEEPAFDLLELAEVPGGPNTGPAPAATRGHGRVGALPEPLTLAELAELVAERLPATAHGVRVAGDPEQEIRTVAVGAGSGESLLDDVRRSGADVFITSDLKHHRAGEAREAGAPALVDVAHWAAEWPWLPVVERKVREAAAAAGDTVETHVSTRVTDPWTFRAATPVTLEEQP